MRSKSYSALVRAPPCSQADEKRLYAEAFKSPFNVPLFKTLAAQIKDQELAERVIDGLEYGHVSRFSAPGLDTIFLDFSKPTESSVGHFKATTLQAYRDAGGCVVGPFDRPPFPNSVNQNQPSINHSFDIPKDRWKVWQPGMSRRFIIHGSEPEFVSYNALQPRQAADRPYYTPAKHHAKTARAGRNSRSWGDGRYEVLLFEFCVSSFRLAPSMCDGRGRPVLRVPGRDVWQCLRRRHRARVYDCSARHFA